MQPACWPDWLDEIWAKSAEKGAGGQPETLAQHTWYVLDRLADFIHLRPDLPKTIGVPRLWHILFWAAFLHDFGKAASGFQARLRGGERWPHRHEVLSLAFVDWITSALTPDEQAWVVAAIVSHHKDAEEIADLYSPPDDPDDDQLIERVAELSPAIVQGLWRWLSECAKGMDHSTWLWRTQASSCQSWPDATSAVPAVTKQGVKRIYHWLKVYRRFVRNLDATDNRSLVIGTLALRGHIVNSDQSASAHAGRLPRATLRCRHHLGESGHQSTRACSIIRSRRPNDRISITHRADRQRQDGGGSALGGAAGRRMAGLPRLFYTLPYQASMNAMELRLIESFGEKQVGMQHGRSLLALYRQLLEKDYDPKKAAREARWARNLAQLNYPPVRVFSPYQMLKGMYRLKGYEALLTDYHGAAFIFDEIHAYEVTRLAMILKTIDYLAQNLQRPLSGYVSHLSPPDQGLADARRWDCPSKS